MIKNLFAVIFKSLAQITIVPLRIRVIVFTNSSLKDIRNKKFIISEDSIFIKWMSCKTNSRNINYNINNSMHIKKSYANVLIGVYKYIIKKIKIVLYHEFLFIQVYNPASCDFIFIKKKVLYSCI